MDFVPGALVAGRYRLRRMVGSGGMGEVWAGEDVKSGAQVAVKHLLPAAAKHHEVVARFKREAYLLGRVESNYVARVIDFFDDELYGLVLVMEYIEGPSLAHILEQRTLEVEEAIDLAVDLLHALEDLHASKIVHRDLKPGNIIMRPLAGGVHRACVVDFGISRLLPGKGENEVTGITRANIALGTVEYMAPEQILNSRDVTPVTDLYAVGIILFRAVKGHHAFGDRRGEELARAKLIEEAPVLDCGRRDDIAAGLVSLVSRALKKKPSQRYPSATQMLAEVTDLQRRARQNLDLDEATTDSGDTVDTAVKPSPLAAVHDSDGVMELPPAATAGPRVALPSKPDMPKVELKQRPIVQPSVPRISTPAPQPPQPPRPPIHSVSEIPQPASGRTSGADWQAEAIAAQQRRASNPSLESALASPRTEAPTSPRPDAPRSAPRSDGGDSNGPRAPLGSLPEIGSGVRQAPPSDRDAVASVPRPSMPSIPDFTGGDSAKFPPRSELTGERTTGLSRGTIALAILTAFAVGAAVGLIVAPTNAPATKAAESCAPCASLANASTATTSEPTSTATSTAGGTPTVVESASAAVASASASAKASASASAKASASASAKVASAKPDGLGEYDPPKPRPPPPPPPPPPPTFTLLLPPPPPPPTSTVNPDML